MTEVAGHQGFGMLFSHKILLGAIDYCVESYEECEEHQDRAIARLACF